MVLRFAIAVKQPKPAEILAISNLRQPASGHMRRGCFERLLDGGETLAAERGLHRIEAGVNLSRSQAYRQMLARGFRTDIQGVAMHRPDLPAYNRVDVFLVDDWR